MSYTWVRRGERKRLPYENPQGRRVNVLAALVKHGVRPALYWLRQAGSLRAEHLVPFLKALPELPIPTVAVLDNGSLHRNAVVRAALPELWAAGVYLYFLPPYSPELNEIEPAFRVIKQHELPERCYASLPALIDAIDTAFTTYEEGLIAKHQHYLRPAA